MSESAPENIAKGVGKKVGPLPLWAYAAIIVGGAYGVYWWKNRVGTSTPVVQTEVGSGMSASGPMPGTGTYDGTVTGGNKAGPAAQTNAQWAKKVADGMIATGSNPTDANNAVAAYINGQPLTAVQQAIINVALTIYGNPPEGVVSVKGPGVYTGFLRDMMDGSIFGIGADGSRTWLSPEQYKLLGSPKWTSTVQNQYSSYARDDATGKIYGITGSGARVWLSAADYKALGSPAINTHFTGDNLAAGQTFSGSKYVVKSGDTWGSIAQANYGSTDTGTLTKANPGVTLTPGTVITIP
jgi:hypothetical protein